MPAATGTLKFPSVIPRLLFSKEVGEGRDGRDESNTIDFFLLKKWHLCVCVCVCMYSVYYFVMIPIFFFPPKFAVIFSTEGAFWLL